MSGAPLASYPGGREGKRRTIPLLIAAGLVVAAVLISIFRDMGIVDSWKLRKTERELRAEVEKLRQENALLKLQVEGLKSSPSVIEEEARRMGLVKEGEQVIVVPPPAQSRVPTSAKPPGKHP